MFDGQISEFPGATRTLISFALAPLLVRCSPATIIARAAPLVRRAGVDPQASRPVPSAPAVLEPVCLEESACADRIPAVPRSAACPDGRLSRRPRARLQGARSSHSWSSRSPVICRGGTYGALDYWGGVIRNFIRPATRRVADLVACRAIAGLRALAALDQDRLERALWHRRTRGPRHRGRAIVAAAVRCHGFSGLPRQDNLFMRWWRSPSDAT